MHRFLTKQQAICYLFITFYSQTTTWRRPPSFATRCLILSNCKTVKTANSSGQQLLTCAAISCRISRFSSCIVCERLLYTRSFKYPIGRNQGPWGPVTVQAMEYPIHESALHRSLTRYILDRSTVTDQNRFLKWRTSTVSRRADLAPYSSRRARVRSEMCQSALRHPVP